MRWETFICIPANCAPNTSALGYIGCLKRSEPNFSFKGSLIDLKAIIFLKKAKLYNSL